MQVSLDLSWGSHLSLTACVLVGRACWLVGGVGRARLSRRMGGFRESLGCWDRGLGLGGWPGGVVEAVECGGELVCPVPVGTESEVPAAW
jgi:hypothetical protein